LRPELVLAGDAETLLIGEGKRTKEEGVRDREERCRCGNAEGEQQHGGEREAASRRSFSQADIQPLYRNQVCGEAPEKHRRCRLCRAEQELYDRSIVAP